MRRRPFISVLTLGLVLSLIFISSCKRKGSQQSAESLEPVDTLEHIYFCGICIDSLDVTEYPIKPGDHMSGIFSQLGFSAQTSESYSQVLSEVLDPKKLRAGMNYYTYTTQDSIGDIRYMAFASNITDYSVIDLTKERPVSYSYSKPITLQQKFVEGTLQSSLWNEMKSKGIDPLLALYLSDVYAWQIDFFDVKEGDSYQVIYNEAFIDDTTAIGISSIEGATFTHIGKLYTAIPFTQDSLPEFFDEEGNSLRKAFLKAPLDFFRITSRFTNARLHPVLKTYRAHHGVDYAAPVGTPVKTIGDGTVVFKGYQGGGAGNYLKIQHNSVYQTTYMHLSRFAKGIKQGSRVKQGEVIGYVGSTGLSTGPHLDFRVYKNGTPINPLTMEAPPSHPVKPELRDSFMIVKDDFLLLIDSLSKLSNDTIVFNNNPQL